MSIRLFCSDVDGTLIKNDGTISARTLEAVRALKEKNVTFVISSGRAFRALEVVRAFYGLDCPVVCSNGAVVFDPVEHEAPFTTPLPDADVRYLAEVRDRYDLVIGLNALDEIAYSGRDGEEDRIYENMNRRFAEQAGFDMPLSFSAAHWRDIIGKKEILKISFWSKDDETHTALRKELEENDRFTLTSAMERQFEITVRGLTKWAGIERLMKNRGIAQEEVACIGDSLNDYEMVKAAGVGIAMGNGHPELKKVAAFVTEDNEHDGVAVAISQSVIHADV